jgi:hypothetical protein
MGKNLNESPISGYLAMFLPAKVAFSEKKLTFMPTEIVVNRII